MHRITIKLKISIETQFLRNSLPELLIHYFVLLGEIQ